MLLTPSDLQAIWLTLRLAGLVTLILFLVGTPIAWWLARSRAWWKGPIGAVVALPLVLPPSVLGFYLLIVAASISNWPGQKYGVPPARIKCNYPGARAGINCN